MVPEGWRVVPTESNCTPGTAKVEGLTTGENDCLWCISPHLRLKPETGMHVVADFFNTPEAQLTRSQAGRCRVIFLNTTLLGTLISRVKHTPDLNLRRCDCGQCGCNCHREKRFAPLRAPRSAATGTSSGTQRHRLTQEPPLQRSMSASVGGRIVETGGCTEV